MNVGRDLNRNRILSNQATGGILESIFQLLYYGRVHDGCITEEKRVLYDICSMVLCLAVSFSKMIEK